MSDRRGRPRSAGTPGNTPWVPIAAGVLLGVGMLAFLYKYLSAASQPPPPPPPKQKCNKDPDIITIQTCGDVCNPPQVLMKARLKYPEDDSCVDLPEECDFC